MEALALLSRRVSFTVSSKQFSTIKKFSHTWFSDYMIAVGGYNPEAESDNEELTNKTELFSLTGESWSLEKDYPFGPEYLFLKT